ncbi:MAG: GTPase Era [Alphaproteobacteria bacterium]|nr:GTPase Era [Alphaproteobacteria bacterium]
MNPEKPLEKLPEKTITRAGFVALVGAPNAGKSTLLNQLAGERLSIVHRKAQTTRSRFRAIIRHKDCQFIMVDTPGIFKPRDRFDEAMVDNALAAAADADTVWLVIDAAAKNANDMITHLMEKLQKSQKTSKTAILLNKVDRIDKEKLLPLIEKIKKYTEENNGKIFMISALEGDGCTDLLDDAYGEMPLSEALYPTDILTDSPLRMMAAEITRLHVFERMHQEIPYQIAVETVSWETRDDGSVKIEQTLFVGRESFKKMILGKKGQKIKEISMAARGEIEILAGCKVHLMLRVKYQENWRQLKEFRVIQGLE